MDSTKRAPPAIRVAWATALLVALPRTALAGDLPPWVPFWVLGCCVADGLIAIAALWFGWRRWRWKGLTIAGGIVLLLTLAAWQEADFLLLVGFGMPTVLVPTLAAGALLLWLGRLVHVLPRRPRHPD